MVKLNEELTKRTGAMAIDASISSAPVQKAVKEPEPIKVGYCDSYDPKTRTCDHGSGDMGALEHRSLDGDR